MNWFCLSICLPLFQDGINYLRKRNTLVNMVKIFFQILFSTFFGLRDKLRKGARWSFLFHIFFKLSKHEKDTKLFFHWTC